jgi:predicted Zn-ribbon and HTH transcriptional regulator
MDAKKIQAAKTNTADTRLSESRAALAVAAGYLVADSDRAAAEAELKQLRASMIKTAAMQTSLQIALTKMSEARTQAEQHAELKRLRSQAADLRKRLLARAAADERKTTAEQALADRRDVTQRAKAAVDELVRVRRSGFDGTCPVTCESCPVADQVTESARAAEELLRERMEAHEAAMKLQTHARDEAEAAAAQTADLDRAAARYQQVVERGKQLSAALTLTEEEASAMPSAAPTQLKLEELQRQASEEHRRAGELESMLAGAAKHVARHEQLESAVSAAERNALVSRLALRAISSVPARIAEQQLGELEMEANQLLEGTGVGLRFSWARELADKAAICDECGYVYPSKRGDSCPSCKAVRGKKRSQELEFLCDDGSGAEEDARFNSGGTRAIVGSSLRLAASAMLRRLRSSRAAWAIVDEPFGSLDVENREQLARTFAGMLGSVGLEQALVVSHDPALLAALPSRIVVDKDGSASTVRVE